VEISIGKKVLDKVSFGRLKNEFPFNDLSNSGKSLFKPLPSMVSISFPWILLDKPGRPKSCPSHDRMKLDQSSTLLQQHPHLDDSPAATRAQIEEKQQTFQGLPPLLRRAFMRGVVNLNLEAMDPLIDDSDINLSANFRG
jgi:hypothetical protein